VTPGHAPLGRVRAPRDRAPGSLVALSGVSGGSTATWAELVRAVDGVRRRLRARDVSRPVVICRDRFHFAAVLLAAWSDGHGVVLPPNGALPSHRALASQQDGTVVVDVVDDDWVSDALRDVAGAPSPELDEALLDQILRRILDDRGGRHLVCAYTSGTTGASVAVHKTAGQLLGEAAMLAAHFALGDEARVLATAPPHHLYGLLFSVLLPLMGGGAFVRESPLHPEAVAAMARTARANVYCGAPPHLHALQALATDALVGTRVLFCSGGRLPDGVAAAVQARHGLEILEILGSTETGGIGWRRAGPQPGQPGVDDLWSPLPGVTVAEHADGVLALDSPYVEPEAPRPVRVADRIALGPDGRFRHLGRADGIVKVGGARVSLGALEQRLLAMPGVVDAAVVAVADAGPRQHEICAAVVVAGTSAFELKRALRAELDAVAVPRRLMIVASLPRESTGKLCRENVLALFGETP
jgi:acyl-CoA synthetase (AMP-forming)/AMP-acid ligase II